MTITADGRDALARASMSEMLVLQRHASVFTAHLTTFAHTSREQGAAHYAETVASVEQMYGVEAPRERTKPFIFNDGIAIIPVHGILLNRFNSCWGFATGYNFIRAQMNAADADDDVTLIVFDVNSPGGDAAGCFELTAEIRALGKPTIAVVDDLGASGGYAIPAAAKRMVCTPSGSVGSIGVYRLHVDLSEAMAQEGVKFTFVTAGEHKVDGNPYEALPDDVRADMQASVDKRWGEFIADVAESRGLSEDDVRATEARVYRADEALALSLIDAVSTPTEAVSAFLAELASDEPEEDDENMALPKTDAELAILIENARNEGVASVQQPDTAKIASDAVAADRQRRQSILALDEAKDKQKLAGTLADTDGMTADTAKVILASAASEKAEAPAGGSGGSAFGKAMDQAGGAGVTSQDGGDGGNGGGQADPNAPSERAASILKFVPASRRADAK